MIIGSRGSMLALWQARHVQTLLRQAGLDSRIEIIHTTGDKITDVPLAQLGAQTSTKGLFTKELEEALLDGRIDLAVHSLKDMPTELPAGLELAAIPEREDPFDAVVGLPVEELPHGARVGTSSLRRQAQLRALRPDLEVESVRGNVDTRLRKLDEGQYASILLACAGLRRLGWSGRIAERLSANRMCPAVGQGALAIEVRSGDRRAALLNHPATEAAVAAERACLRSFGGGCQIPLGAYAEWQGERLHLHAVVCSLDGKCVLRVAETQQDGEAPEQLGERAARLLSQMGAHEVLG
ncbi:MAG: hydroxymethylbilane synthase [Bryobacter sp.]|nr:hydroxymethylbilane synthase [Bryobacter sp.]